VRLLNSGHHGSAPTTWFTNLYTLPVEGHGSGWLSVLNVGGNVMKKCPICYAIMRESITPTQMHELQHKPIDGTPKVSVAGIRYECSQCGHMEESFAKPALAPLGHQR
jgi:hypothetical protein